MSDLDTTIRYTELLEIYQNLLSKAQKEMLEDYFFYNLSFSEIAENRKVSRAAVEDAIKKGNNNLDMYEKEIGSLKALQELREIRLNSKDEELNNKLLEVERILKHGI